MKTTTIKVQMGALLLAGLAGCGSPDTGSGAAGSGGSVTSSGGSTSSSSGGTGGSATTTTSTTSTGGSECNVPGPIECGPAITGYPDPFASYDPSALDVGPIDGSKDPELGWAYLDSPTAPGVGAYPNNPAIRVNVTP